MTSTPPPERTQLERELAMLHDDRILLGGIGNALRASRLGEPVTWVGIGSEEAIARAIGRIDVMRGWILERQTFAIAGRGFDTLFGPDTTSPEALSALAEAACAAMISPRPDFHLDPSSLEPDERAAHDAACDAYAEAQQSYLDLATEERVFALALLGVEVLRELKRGSLADVSLRAPYPREPEVSP